MSGKAIGMVEYRTVSMGITAVDAMVKTASIDIIEAQTVCPGKYIAIICGELSAIMAALAAAEERYGEQLIGSFILGNPHESIFPAIYGTTNIINRQALGIIETYDAVSIIVAADVAAKTAVVDLIEIRIAKGMCGKSFMLITGEVAAVEQSVAKAKKAAAERGMYLDSSVIANPDETLYNTIL